MLCYQCIVTWEGVTGVTGKLKNSRFYDVRLIMQGEKYLLVMKRKRAEEGL